MPTAIHLLVAFAMQATVVMFCNSCVFSRICSGVEGFFYEQVPPMAEKHRKAETKPSDRLRAC